ncbi:MAG: DUF2797 domain-containing protein [Prolixibacteraceae bacterium]|nr:DUF2797 domain-containing protein [Prolixibacteraceae bacterium]
MQVEGNILKMKTENKVPVQYHLPLGNAVINMNDFIGKVLKLEFTGQINCISCGKPTKISYSQGFCFNCVQTSPEASESIIRPELSKAEFGVARDMEWARKHDLIEHVVYLAASPQLKVGVTRIHQVPVRWIDQGASRALVIARMPNRHIAGIMEVWLKQFFADKTNWREMLQNSDSEIDLYGEREKALGLLTPELKKYAVAGENIVSIEYPVSAYPEKVSAASFDKSSVIEGVLTGIKGQYLIFEDSTVVNIRKHNGYYIRISGE